MSCRKAKSRFGFPRQPDRFADGREHALFQAGDETTGLEQNLVPMWLCIYDMAGQGAVFG